MQILTEQYKLWQKLAVTFYASTFAVGLVTLGFILTGRVSDRSNRSRKSSDKVVEEIPYKASQDERIGESWIPRSADSATIIPFVDRIQARRGNTTETTKTPH